jgi:hypothetical protein
MVHLRREQFCSPWKRNEDAWRLFLVLVFEGGRKSLLQCGCERLQDYHCIYVVTHVDSQEGSGECPSKYLSATIRPGDLG